MRGTLPDRIRSARRRKGWSQSELGARLGVTASAVGHWERPAGHAPCLSRVMQLAGTLGVGIEWLISGRADGGVHARLEGVPHTEVPDQQFVLEALATLSPDARRLVLGMMRAICTSMTEQACGSREQAAGAMARYLGFG
ncbi:helix-turn-helix domain-containing protein [Luteimonas sp. A501]